MRLLTRAAPPKELRRAFMTSDDLPSGFYENLAIALSETFTSFRLGRSRRPSICRLYIRVVETFA